MNNWRSRLKRLFAFHPLYLLGFLLGVGAPLVYSGAFFNHFLLINRIPISIAMLVLLFLLYWKPLYRGRKVDKRFRGSGWCSLGQLIGVAAVLLGAGTGARTQWILGVLSSILILQDIGYLIHGDWGRWEDDEETKQQSGPEL